MDISTISSSIDEIIDDSQEMISELDDVRIEVNDSDLFQSIQPNTEIIGPEIDRIREKAKERRKEEIKILMQYAAKKAKEL